jgi:sugar phosphate isomerase/epimerase
MTRQEFLQTMSAAVASALIPTSRASAQAPRPKSKRGVSLYSYQEEYYTHAMTLEDCLAEVASMGADGVEVIAEEMVPNYPDPPESWVKQWHGLLEKYHTKPVCLDTFVDTTWGGHRQMSLQESVDTLVTQMKLSHRLGFKVMRPTTGPVVEGATEMIKRALPLAEKYDVKIAVEIHSPIRLRSKFIDDYLELISQTHTRHFGFTADMGIFAKRIPRVVKDFYIRRGAHESIVQYLSTAFEDGLAPEKARAEIEKMGPNEVDRGFAFMAFAYGPVANDPKDLRNIMPYIYNVHGKFYEMTEDFREYSIPYEQIIPVLAEGGYDGYINSEYEGQRSTQDAFETDSCEQVRRHHVMLRRLLGEI